MSTNTFRRIEKKYRINQEQYASFLFSINKHLKKDCFSIDKDYPIYNIYFDSIKNVLISKSIKKPYFKEKLRIRSYSLKSDNCFFEIKRKVGKTVYKRRIALTYDEAICLTYKGIIASHLSICEKQIAREIWELIRSKHLIPKVFLSYQRCAYYDPMDTEFRLTLDHNIIYRYDHLSFHEEADNDKVILDNEFIVEVKFTNALPIWFTDALSDSRIFSTSFSKYGKAYEQNVLKGEEKHVQKYL